MSEPSKRGGARPGSGAPRKPADQSAVVRFSLALPPAEATEYKRFGATRWLRRMLSEGPIEWISVSSKFPPIGEWVITARAGHYWPSMETNALRYGNAMAKQDPSLLYWDCGSCFDEVTHWSKLPNMPEKHHASLPSTEIESNRPTMGHHNEGD